MSAQPLCNMLSQRDQNAIDRMDNLPAQPDPNWVTDIFIDLWILVTAYRRENSKDPITVRRLREDGWTIDAQGVQLPASGPTPSYLNCYIDSRRSGTFDFGGTITPKDINPDGTWKYGDNTHCYFIGSGGTPCANSMGLLRTLVRTQGQT